MAHDTYLPPDDGGIVPRTRHRSAIRLVRRARRARTVRERALLPVMGAADVVLPVFDAKLGEFARRAQAGDTDARDALYFAFQPKVTRMTQTVHPPFAPEGATGLWDHGDLAQEAYLVFVELILAWPGDVPLTAYVMSRFPWRIRDTIRRGVARPSVPPRRRVVPIETAAMVAGDAGPAAGVSELLDALAAQLPPPLDDILIAHVLHGKTKTEIAAEIGVSRRTMVRHWREIQRRALAALTPGAGNVQ
jgi:RNA polymerase sigma factor (sigma-70 family)